MAKVTFTEGTVSGLACDPGKAQTIHWDAKADGLGCRVTSTGAKAYIFQSRLNGASLRVTIGSPNAWPLRKAQTEARRLQTLIDQGIDPRHERQDRAAEHAARRQEDKQRGITLGEVWADYIAARRHTWGERHAQDHAVMMVQKTGRAPLESLRDVLLSDLDGARVEAWLKTEVAYRPTRAALAFRLLRACLNWCAESAQTKNHVNLAAVTSRHVRESVPSVKAKDDDCLQREQLPAWFAAVGQIGNPVIAAYLQGLLLTGARRGELLGLTWEDADFQWQRLTIRDKVEGERTIPLTPYLAHLIGALPRRNRWVFSSPASASGRLQEPNIAHVRALRAAGLPHITLHGLRRSFSTLSECIEVPTGVTAQIMGHKPSAISERHYKRRPVDLLRVWHERIEAWMLEQAGITFDASAPRLRAVV